MTFLHLFYGHCISFIYIVFINIHSNFILLILVFNPCLFILLRYFLPYFTASLQQNATTYTAAMAFCFDISFCYNIVICFTQRKEIYRLSYFMFLFSSLIKVFYAICPIAYDITPNSILMRDSVL